MIIRRAFQPSLLKRLPHMVFVGKYIQKEDADDTYFQIQCLSPIPSGIKDIYATDQPIFSGFKANKYNEKFLSRTPLQEREAMLVLFRLYYCNSSLHVEIIKAEKRVLANSYCLIPVPLLQKGHSREVLERKLAKGHTSFLLSKYSSDFGMPELLFREGRLYGNLDLHSTMSTIMFAEKSMEIVYMDVENWESHVEMQADDTLYFVTDDTFRLLQNQMRENGQKLLVNFQTKVALKTTNVRELQFLNNLKQLTLEKNLYFEEVDIYNLHICLKTNPITIVGGMSGIGKSKLVQVYGEALGLTYGEQLLFVPISPSFQEPQDLLGYLHPNGTFIESESGIVQILLEAAAHPEQVFMIVFDEMNLSIIEHWFMPFISLLELEEEKRILRLHGMGNLQNQTVPPSIKIGSNIVFVGTVNFDETTKELSDRLLDRVNVVELKKLPFRESFHMKRTTKSALNQVSSKEYRLEWNNYRPISTVFSEEELEIFDMLHEVLQSVDPHKGVSFRTVSGIASYLDNIPTDERRIPLISREEAFDLQVVQRIFTKIRGVDSVIGPLLQDDNRQGASLLQLLQSPFAQEVSSFAHSIAYIKQKAKELEMYGYAK